MTAIKMNAMENRAVFFAKYLLFILRYCEKATCLFSLIITVNSCRVHAYFSMYAAWIIGIVDCDNQYSTCPVPTCHKNGCFGSFWGSWQRKYEVWYSNRHICNSIRSMQSIFHEFLCLSLNKNALYSSGSMSAATSYFCLVLLSWTMRGIPAYSDHHNAIRLPSCRVAAQSSYTLPFRSAAPSRS